MPEKEMLSTDQLKLMMMVVARHVQEKKDWLSELDAACGDGDHGVSMARGFAVVEQHLPGWDFSNHGALLRKVGMTLVSGVGGATGPLLGTFFMEAGKAAGEREEMDAATLATVFQAGLDGLCKRGGAKLGEKTMVDALTPAVDALKEAANAGATPAGALRQAADAARKGAESTAHMVAKQGKSRYLGERALGHPDAGAYSIVTILEAMAEGAGGSASTA